MQAQSVRQGAWRLARGLFALAIVVALATQFVLSSDIPGFSAFNFFSFFTVLSNVFAVIVLTVMTVAPESINRWTAWRGAATLYMAVTFLVYLTVLLPMDTDVGVSEPWIDVVIHGIGPLFMIVDWVANPPLSTVTPKIFWSWFAFPAFYLVYSLVRGPIVDWYPYPFLDPREPDGYPGVAISSVIILVVILLIALALRWWANKPRESLYPPDTTTGSVE